jgi:outer membrane protein assembly factor BamA
LNSIFDDLERVTGTGAAKMRGTTKWAVILSASLLLSGCNFFSVSDVPSAFDDDLTFGKPIKEIRLEGNTDTRDDIIYAVMASRDGEVYTRETAMLDRKWLVQLGVFTSLFFDTIEEADSVTLVVKMTEVNKYTPAPVIKVTDENGLSVGGLISSPNALGYAAKASAWFTVGGATNVGIRLKDPWIPGRSWALGYRIDYVHSERFNELYGFNETSDDIFFRLKRNITNNIRWGPQVTYLTVKSDTLGVTLSQNNRDHIPGLGVFLRFDGRNMPIYPTQGWWTGLNVKKYGLGGVDTDYWQVNLDVRRYIEIGSRYNSLAFYSLATLTSGEVGVDIPIYMQFNLGGANSVRGWDLGSREGKNQFLNTLEYWHVLMGYKKWQAWFFKWAMGFQAGVFGDVGTAWSTSEQFNQNWIGGGGVGFRLLLPGSVLFRFDVAAGESGVGVGLFISGREKAVAQRDRVR